MSQNRAMRRKKFKDKHLRKLQTAEDIAAECFAAGKIKMENDMTDEITGRVLTLALWSLHVDFGYGRERMGKFVNSIFQFADIVRIEKLPIDEVCETLLNECKFDLAKTIKNYMNDSEKEYKERRDFLSTYRFSRRITKADQEMG